MAAVDQPIAVDLFSGCGGLTLGLKQAGFRVIGAVEIDPLAAESYRANHKTVKVWESDIRDLSTSEVKSHLKLQVGDLDLLAGCPPCQGFSSMRTLNGSREIHDMRNDLVDDFLRFVKELLPKTVMMENVPGLAKDRRMDELCDGLRELGYVLKYGILNAADYAVPQRRRRLLLLGSQFGHIDFAPPVPDSDRRKVQDAIAGLPPPGQSGDPLHDLQETRSQRIMNLIKKIPANGGSRLDLDTKHQLKCHKQFDGFKDVYGRMSWNNVAPTITSGCVNPSKGRFLHPEMNRAITLREAALLQTFPPDYFISLKRGKYAAAALIGNALPPEFVKRHACEVRNHLQTLRLELAEQ